MMDRGIDSIPLQRVTSLPRRAQANAHDAFYWLSRVLNDGGRRDYRHVHQATDAGRGVWGEACNAMHKWFL